MLAVRAGALARLKLGGRLHKSGSHHRRRGPHQLRESSRSGARRTSRRGSIGRLDFDPRIVAECHRDDLAPARASRAARTVRAPAVTRRARCAQGASRADLERESAPEGVVAPRVEGPAGGHGRARATCRRNHGGQERPMFPPVTAPRYSARVAAALRIARSTRGRDFRDRDGERRRSTIARETARRVLGGATRRAHREEHHARREQASDDQQQQKTNGPPVRRTHTPSWLGPPFGTTQSSARPPPAISTRCGFPGRRDRVDVVAPQVRQRRRVVERRAPRGVDGAAERRRELVRRARMSGQSARLPDAALPRTLRASTSFAPARSYLRFFARGGAAGASQRFAPRPTSRDDAGPTRDVTPQASRR